MQKIHVVGKAQLCKTLVVYVASNPRGPGSNPGINYFDLLKILKKRKYKLWQMLMKNISNVDETKMSNVDETKMSNE